MKESSNVYVYGILFNLPEDNIKMPSNGESEQKLFSYNDISAIVEESKIIVEPENCKKDVLAHLLVKHQRVIEHFMNMGYTVIPMKLASYLKDEKEIKILLKNAYNLIKSFKSDLDAGIELDIVATWADFSEVLRLTGKNKTISDIREKMLCNPKEITISEQEELGFTLSRLIKEKNMSQASNCYEFLRTKYLKLKEHDVMNDEMIFNTSFLIKKVDLDAFNDLLCSLDDILKGKINFRCVGPLPCYSFCTLEIIEMDFILFKKAMKLLELNDSTSLNDLKKNYRTKIAVCHPDKTNDVNSLDEFKKIGDAYKKLSDFFTACKCADSNFEKMTLSEKDIKQKQFLIKVKE